VTKGDQITIKYIELFHGVVLSKITRNKANTISLIEHDGKDGGRAIYKLTTDKNELSVFITYRTNLEEKENTQIWHFNNLTYQTNYYFCLLCLNGKNIKGNIGEVCAISSDEMKKLLSQEEISKEESISCIVSLKKNESFRVSRRRKGKEIIIARNQVDKI